MIPDYKHLIYKTVSIIILFQNKQYLSQGEARDVLHDKRTWHEYKTELMKKMVELHCH